MTAASTKRGERLPSDIALAIIPSLPRQYLERLVQRLVDHLDEQDGDPDIEDATDAEDEGLHPATIAYASDGPGCILMDTDNEDDREGIGEEV